MSNSPEDDIPIPSEPVLSEEESIRQINADMARPYLSEIARLKSERDQCANALRALRECQNGAPSFKKQDLDDWNKAMTAADAILAKL